MSRSPTDEPHTYVGTSIYICINRHNTYVRRILLVEDLDEYLCVDCAGQEDARRFWVTISSYVPMIIYVGNVYGILSTFIFFCDTELVKINYYVLQTTYYAVLCTHLLSKSKNDPIAKILQTHKKSRMCPLRRPCDAWRAFMDSRWRISLNHCAKVLT